MSLARMLEMATKWGRRFPPASTTGKYRWCFRMGVMMTSRGSSRYSRLNEPQITVGNSTRCVTVSTSSSSRTAWPLTAAAASVASFRTSSRRRPGSTMTNFSSSFSR